MRLKWALLILGMIIIGGLFAALTSHGQELVRGQIINPGPTSVEEKWGDVDAKVNHLSKQLEIVDDMAKWMEDCQNLDGTAQWEARRCVSRGKVLLAREHALDPKLKIASYPQATSGTGAITPAGPVSPKYVPTELESLRLQNEQKDARITQAQMQSLQQQLQALQAQFQSQLAAVTADAERIKEAHKWDKAVTFDVNSLTFNDPPPAPAKKDDKK